MADRCVSYEDMISFQSDRDVLMIDVRKPEELQETGVITGAINIPLDSLESVLKKTSAEDFKSKYGRDLPNEDARLVFSCNKGGRATKALNAALDLGFVNAKIFKGGWVEWSNRQ